MKLDQFTARNDLREWMNTPFSISKYTVATDGRTILCLPRDDKQYPELADAKAAALLDPILQVIDDTPLTDCPELNLPEADACRVCRKSGYAEVTECEECGGCGALEFVSGINLYAVDCRSCSGEGFVVGTLETESSCPKCRGVGKAYQDKKKVRIFGAPFDAALILPIANAPGLRVELIKEKRMLVFQSEDARGIIMGLRDE